MNEILDLAGYEQTKEKLSRLENRLRRLERQTNLSGQHRLESQRSYERMIGQYRSEIKLFEAAHPGAATRT